MIPGKERQKKWKQKQLIKGLKPVTLMLSKQAKAILEKESRLSGKTLSVVAEKIILDSSSSNKKAAVQVTSDDITSSLSPVTSPEDTSERSAEQIELLKKISNLRGKRGKKT